MLFPTRNIKLHLTPIHKGHLGLIKCKLRAKDTVYLPGLNEQFEKLVLNCELCLKYSHFKCKQKPCSSLGQEIPVHSWTKLATDTFHFESSSYLLIVDYTSRFPVVCKLSLMAGLYIANQYKQVFSEYGWPETLVSGNGPCYTSKQERSIFQACVSLPMVQSTDMLSVKSELKKKSKVLCKVERYNAYYLCLCVPFVSSILSYASRVKYT